MRYPSRVFVAAAAWKARLDEVSYPTHPQATKPPKVEFGDEDPTNGAERIGLNVNADDTVAEWARLSPAGKDETIVLQAVIRSYVDNVKTSAEAWARLEELAGLVEGTAYDTVTSRMASLGYDGELQCIVSGVQPTVFPTPTGWYGVCVITLRTIATI